MKGINEVPGPSLGGVMQVGIISDTHDNIEAIDTAVSIFKDVGVETVIHCGDFVAPPSIDHFEGLDLHGVLGNNDGELDGLEQTIEGLSEASTLHGRYADLAFDGIRVFVLHGDQGRDVIRDYAATSWYEYVFFGHFHEQETYSENGTRVVNPGAHFPTVPATHRSIAILDTVQNEIEFKHLT